MGDLQGLLQRVEYGVVCVSVCVGAGVCGCVLYVPATVQYVQMGTVWRPTTSSVSAVLCCIVYTIPF